MLRTGFRPVGSLTVGLLLLAHRSSLMGGTRSGAPVHPSRNG
jgi:hypothetical protein